MIGKKTNVKSFDTTLMIIYVVLVVIGWLAIFSSSVGHTQDISIFDFSKPYGKQFIWIGISAILSIVILTLEARVFMNYAYYIYAFCLLLMLLVFFLGTSINGAKAWIKIGQFSIQPAEFAKFATALALAKFFNDGKTDKQRANQWIVAGLMVLVPIVIIMLQHDAGSALVYLSFIFLFYREGMSGNIFIIGVGVFVLFLLTFCLNEIYAVSAATALYIAFMIFNRRDKRKMIKTTAIFLVAVGVIFAINPAYNKLLEPHQRMRIETLFGKTVDPQGADFNLNQSKIAIGSGGFFGKGFLKGTQTKLDFVPERHTDFIFCSIGEEFGFLGSLVIVSLFVWLILRILFLAERHRIRFVRYYGYSVASIIFVHFIINIGMTIGLMPIIGIPLPFLSYGGSSLIAFTILLFVFIRLNEM
ncbi:MAG: rod shape-determining protein RodA [Bacteroidales bacterium]|nr:rod shape-determining protein RodA [Bacteroidales bacterium]